MTKIYEICCASRVDLNVDPIHFRYFKGKKVQKLDFTSNFPTRSSSPAERREETSYLTVVFKS